MKEKMTKFRIGLMSAVLGLGTGVVLAQEAVGLHVFQPGQVISSSQVNENFALLDDKIEANTQAITELAGLDPEKIERILQLLEQLGPDQITEILNIINNNSTEIEELQQSITQINQSISEITSNAILVENRVTELEEKTQFISVEGQTTLFSSTNVQIVNGSGLTGTENGLGNLIIGYNEMDEHLACYGVEPVRTGSHCLVVGSNNSYSGTGSSVLGHMSGVHGDYSTVIGCGRTVRGDCRFRFAPESRHHHCNNEDDCQECPGQ